jgi:hypothetical protein
MRRMRNSSPGHGASLDDVILIPKDIHDGMGKRLVVLQWLCGVLLNAKRNLSYDR